MVTDTRGGGTWVPAAAFFLLLLALAPAASAQRRGKAAEYEVPPAVDPYTEGDPEALQAAGYVAFAPFHWAEEHDTRDVEEALGLPVLWVETAHFRIGSTLWKNRISDDREEKRKVSAELDRLRERLPNVPKRVREIDPWLRLHLYAQRLEETYAEFREDFGVEDVDFPSHAGAKGRPHPMGRGPYLGMPAKYTVLLTEKASTLGRYTGHFLGGVRRGTWRHFFRESGSLFVGTAVEFLEGPYENDTALHCSLAFAVAQNLVDGFRDYTVASPLWFKEGLGHVYVRRLDARYPLFSGSNSTARDRNRDEDWEPKIRGRAEHEYFPKALELFAWTDADALDLSDHRMAWSRVDYLLRNEPSAAPAFLMHLKEPVRDAKTLPTPEELVQRQVTALERALDLEPADFDRAWCEWVLREYARR